MKKIRWVSPALLAISSALCAPTHAASELQTINGIAAGGGTGCDSFMPATELASFTSRRPKCPSAALPLRATAGGCHTQTATAGPLTQSDALGPVMLGSLA